MTQYFKLILCTCWSLLLACQQVLPTPILFGHLKDANEQTLRIYEDCLAGANYRSDLETCDSEKLEEQTLATLTLAKQFISADIHQAQGYDIYLQTALIYFRISQRNANQYSEAEKIARQFFEIQKSTGGRSLNLSRYYWASIAASFSAWQWYEDPLLLDDSRKVELLAAYTEGNIALQEITPGPQKIRLIQSLTVLKTIIESLP